MNWYLKEIISGRISSLTPEFKQKVIDEYRSDRAIFWIAKTYGIVSKPDRSGYTNYWIIEKEQKIK